jgi:predicted DNA-binding antitoxin AbrB/MazE fold protein
MRKIKLEDGEEVKISEESYNNLAKSVKEKYITREMTLKDKEIYENKILNISLQEDGTFTKEIKSGTVRVYTIILGLAKAPFFTKPYPTGLGVTDRWLNERLKEYYAMDS